MPRNRGRALRRIAAAAAIATICALVGATGAAAASAPKSFFGVVPQTPLDAPTLKRMGDANVGTLRIIITWSSIDPTRRGRRRGLVDDRPGRARGRPQRDRRAPVHLRHPGLGRQGPRRPELQRLEVRALRAEVQAGAATPGRPSSARRSTATGPGGEFWAQHPEVPADPIRAWQIWNEQNSKSFYAPKPNPKALREAALGGREGDPLRATASRGRGPRRHGRARRLEEGDRGLRSTWPSSTTSRARARASTASRRTRTARASTRSPARSTSTAT